MKTLNEQIQRVRDILHTCYESIARKGGTLPPVGERNMTNLPDAVESVPQVVGAELEELTITQNGTYTPQEGVDGFSKVTAMFDTSSLPKVKVMTFRISNDCIKEGRWEGDTLIDLSNATSMNDMARGCKDLEYINMDNWNVNGIPMPFNSMFQECSNIKELDFSKWDKVYPTNMTYMFYGCGKLEEIKGLDKFDTSSCTNFSNLFSMGIVAPVIDITSWDFSSATTINMIMYKTKITNIVGGKSINDVISDNIGTLNNSKISFSLGASYVGYNALDRASLRSMINGVADLTGQTTATMTIGAANIAKLTEEDIAIATAKNWSIA